MEDHHTTEIQFMAKLDQMEHHIVMLDKKMEEMARYALKVHFMQSEKPTNGIVLVQKQPT
jgi:energy-coupling factor transporter ATP-binding protein EcfA2